MIWELILAIKVGIKESVIVNGHEYQMKSVVVGELKPMK
jgi:hypothetical protein